MKKVISMCVVIMTLISSMFVFADNQSTAEILSEMNLISGDDEGFNLDKQLTRSEASTFIVKLLGEEVDVKERKAMYIKSNFEDITGDEWYAMYIGYCERHGILTGYPDGTVKAGEALSEKAFLTMVLKALGYEDQFTWDNVYEYSKEIGLIDSVEENTNTLTRGDAVEIMYRALKTPKLDKGYLTEDLLSRQIVTEEILKKYHFVDEVEVTETTSITVEGIEVKNIKADGYNNIDIEFNQKITDVALDGIVVKDRVSQNSIRVKSYTMSGNTVTIRTDKHDNVVLYDVLLSRVTGENGKIAENLSGTFVSLNDDTADIPFEMTSVVVKDSNTIELNFSRKLWIIARYPSNYKFYKDGVEILNYQNGLESGFVDDSQMVVYIKYPDGFQSGETYEIEICNPIVSDDDQTFNNGEYIRYDFIGQ